MLARLNTSSEISLFPTGLGNHYTSGNRNLVPPGRRRFPYNHASEAADPGGAAAEHSFREPRERFGPDVLVIAGLAMACAGAALTLVSLYLEFRHPAIQATMAGVGPSLVGIGMLFCVLRLFFCTFCVSRTCCERLRLATFSRPKVHPLRVKDTGAKKAALANGQPLSNGDAKDRQQHNNNNNGERQQGNSGFLPERQQRGNSEFLAERQQKGNSEFLPERQKTGNSEFLPEMQQRGNNEFLKERQKLDNNEFLKERQKLDNNEFSKERQKLDNSDLVPPRMDPIREERRTPEDEEDRNVGGDEDILRDEIDLLDSPRLHEDINDLVQKTGRY